MKSLRKSYIYSIAKSKHLDLTETITVCVRPTEEYSSGAVEFAIEYYRGTGTVGWTAINIKLEDRSLRSLELSIKSLKRIGLFKLGYLPNLHDLIALFAAKGIEQAVYDPMQLKGNDWVPLRKVIRGDVAKWRDISGENGLCNFHVIAKDSKQAVRKITKEFVKQEATRTSEEISPAYHRWLSNGKLVRPIANPLKDEELITAEELIR